MQFTELEELGFELRRVCHCIIQGIGTTVIPGIIIIKKKGLNRGRIQVIREINPR